VALARQPTAEETKLAQNFFSFDQAKLADFCLALLNRNEFVYRP